MRRWQGETQEAVYFAEEALDLADRHGVALGGAVARATLWAARALAGESRAARSQLEEVITDLEQLGARYELIGVLGMQARVALLDRDERAAEQALKSALRLTREVGSVQPLVAEIGHTPILESFVKSRSDEFETIIDGLERLRQVQAQPTQPTPASDHAITATTYSLRVWVLGQEHIERDGKPVSPSQWRATTAREMFLYLLFRGPETRARISLAFWPDSSPDQLRSVFHTTLYRARQAVGEDVIIFREGRYLINPDIDLWCDARELDTLARQARLLPPRDVRAEDLWRKVTELYKGEFLPSLDMDWVHTRREDLWETYLEALIGLSECARARNDFRGALQALHRALEEDPFREDVHRAIMICYAQMGEKQRIMAHLDQLSERLRRELDAAPSDETLRLASLLLN